MTNQTLLLVSSPPEAEAEVLLTLSQNVLRERIKVRGKLE